MNYLMLTCLISHSYETLFALVNWRLLFIYLVFFHFVDVKENGSIALNCLCMNETKFQWLFNSTDLSLLNLSDEVISRPRYELLFLNSIPLSLNNTVIRCLAIMPGNRSVPILETTLYVQGLFICKLKSIEVYYDLYKQLNIVRAL